MTPSVICASHTPLLRGGVAGEPTKRNTATCVASFATQPVAGPASDFNEPIDGWIVGMAMMSATTTSNSVQRRHSGVPQSETVA